MNTFQVYRVIIFLVFVFQQGYAGKIHEISFEESLKQGYTYTFKTDLDSKYSCKNEVDVDVVELDNKTDRPKYELSVYYSIIDSQSKELKFKANADVSRFTGNPHSISICYPHPDDTYVEMTVYYYPKPRVDCKNEKASSCEVLELIPMCPHNYQIKLDKNSLEPFIQIKKDEDE